MLQALRDDVIVKPIFEEHKGLISIPNSALKYKQYDTNVFGEVVSIGSKFTQTFQGDTLTPGDKIIFQRHEGRKFNHAGQTYLKMKSRWVMAKVT